MRMRVLGAAVGGWVCVSGAIAQELRDEPAMGAVSAPQPVVESDEVKALRASGQPDERGFVYGRDPNAWQVDVEPSMWFVGASGKVRLPRVATTGPTGRFQLEDLNMDNPRWEPLVELNVRRGDWRGTFRGAFYGAEKNSGGLSGTLGDVSFVPGDTVRTGLDMTVLEFEGAWTIDGVPQEKQADGTFAFDPRLDVVAGLRVYGQDWSVQNLTSGGESGFSDWFFQPEIGLKMSADLYTSVTLDAQATVGGLPSENSSYSVDIVVGVQWRPWEHVGVQLGYRSLFLGLGDGDGESEFSYDGSLQGLYAGVTVRF